MTELGRASAEDLAIAITEEFAGARGIAKIVRTLLMSGSTQAATKTRIVANITQLLSNTSKLYGDRAKMAGMNKDQLELRLLELLKKHNMVMPIPGIDLHVRQSQEEPV